MSSTKVSISLPDDDIGYLDSETLAGRYPSRSAAVHEALRLLRESRLADAYAEAYGEWTEDDWDVAIADGLDEASSSAPGTGAA